VAPSIYRLLKALIASPAYIVIKAAAAFKEKTTVPDHLEEPLRDRQASRQSWNWTSPFFDELGVLRLHTQMHSAMVSAVSTFTAIPPLAKREQSLQPIRLAAARWILPARATSINWLLVCDKAPLVALT
jgi:hypothetical protein